MNVVRNRAEARWLPSRFHFALFRLFAFVRLVTARNRETPGIIVAIDRGQSTLENYSVAAWVFVTTTCFTAELLRHWMPAAAAVVVGLAATPWILQVPLYAIGLAFPRERVNQGAVSKGIFTLLIAAAALALTRPTWIRWVGVVFIAAVTANAIAALAMLPLRGRIRKMERECGA